MLNTLHRKHRVSASLAALMCGLAAVGCSEESPDQGPKIDSAPEALTLGETLQQLHQHLDLDQSQLALGVDAAHVPAQNAFDAAVFEAHLAAAAGVSVTAQWSEGTTRYAKVGTLMSVIEPETRYIDISDARGYSESQGAAAPTAQLLETTEELLAAMGIDPSEASMSVVPLGAQTDGTAEVERIAQKVFCMRTIGGLRVAGDRMVFSYANDGSLRALRGHWPSVSVSESQWSTTLSQDQVIDRALDAMVAGGAATDSARPITLQTFFEHVQGEGGAWRMTLNVSATRQTTGPEGSGGRGALYQAAL